MKYRQKINGQWSNWINFNIKALDGMPIGSIIMFAGETIPTGWLICDGDTLNEEEYPELYDVIGYTYGGSGLDFNLPDFRGKSAFGYHDMETGMYPLGNTGGTKSHTHQYGFQTNGWYGTLTEGFALWNGNSESWINSSGGAGTKSITTRGGTDTATNNPALLRAVTDTSSSGTLPPYLVVNYIIKATNTTPTMASVVNATNNSTEDTYSCDFINKIVTGSHNNTYDIGYVKLPGNIAICYGRYWPSDTIKVPAGSGAYIDINLPINMVAQQYTVIISKFAGGNGYAMVMDAPTNFQADKFTINMWNNAGSQSEVVGYDWVAIGKYQ